MERRVLPSRYYGDPALVVERNEVGNCAGCAHDRYREVVGQRRGYCNIGHTHGKRCTAFDPSVLSEPPHA